jgi:AcrR family transcriptional regulator
MESSKTQAVRRDESQQLIIRAAFAIIAEEGFDKLSLSLAGRNAGYSRELPRYLFGSKDNFIAALLDDIAFAWGGEFIRDEYNELTGLEILLAVTESLEALFCDDVTFRGRLVLIYSMAGSQNDILRERLLTILADLTTAFTTLMKRGIADGSMLPTTDSIAMSALVHSTYRGIGYQWVMNPESLPLKTVFNELRRLLILSLSSQ